MPVYATPSGLFAGGGGFDMFPSVYRRALSAGHTVQPALVSRAFNLPGVRQAVLATPNPYMSAYLRSGGGLSLYSPWLAQSLTEPMAMQYSAERAVAVPAAADSQFILGPRAPTAKEQKLGSKAQKEYFRKERFAPIAVPTFGLQSPVLSGSREDPQGARAPIMRRIPKLSIFRTL
jgi:hypothetical protein